MSLILASIVSIGLFKVFHLKSRQWVEECPAPFYGDDELSKEYTEAFARKNN